MSQRHFFATWSLPRSWNPRRQRSDPARGVETAAAATPRHDDAAQREQRASASLERIWDVR
jgi:hypothetical protein